MKLAVLAVEEVEPRRAARGVPMPGLAAIREVFQAARAQGWGGEDIAAVCKAVARESTTQPTTPLELIAG